MKPADRSNSEIRFKELNETQENLGNRSYAELRGKAGSRRGTGFGMSSNGKELDRMKGEAESINAVGIKAPS